MVVHKQQYNFPLNVSAGGRKSFSSVIIGASPARSVARRRPLTLSRFCLDQLSFQPIQTRMHAVGTLVASFAPSSRSF
jgi:hypothetical protein